MNLYSILEKGFPKDKQSCALETHDGLYYSWSDLERATAKMANLLKSLKLPKGSRVAVQVEKSPEALFLYLATIRAGYVYLPLNTAYQAAEIGYFLENAEPAVVVCSSKNFSWVSKTAFKAGTQHVFTLDENRTGTLLERAGAQSDRFKTATVKEDDLAAILYTSGTTGRSKGAMLTHKNLSSNAKVLQKFWGWKKGDVLLHALPIFHVHGLFVAAHGALINGSKMIWLPRLDTAQLIHYMPKSTVMMGVPTFYVRLLADKGFTKEVTRNMRLFVSGSAPLLTETFNSFIERTGQSILERYGMSETVMLVSNPYKGKRVGGSVGLPLPGVKVRVVNENNKPCGVDEIGNVQVKGPNVFAGYWRMPEKTAEEFTNDGWFKTGDVGRWGGDANGGKAPKDYLCIVGRSKDLIISGGYNVYPKEIESFIDDMDGVDESAVIGIPHPDFGEAVMAVVVPKAGAKLDAQAMIATLKTQIANFKIPKRLEIVADLPRNAMGKVQKNILRQQYTN
ncbi:malonyl-CoA/methylmalonyl-CoA synthetase [Polynucleobacter sphagniphilus]|jgi:malonyl-CoA/methylmalonyl-CoA synthetase|uniref:malonate--CoA ligase n=1 Tax=Polynucleobacter sphagniphilus TaxID=1743169 RepID=UPI002475D575|nr:malonyl-CoA synthase [Polynucleobacter sphagniphilus]MDH6154761.1 malonyl-CoA/methylmalonyl-CoA synthetase [Polynucleobacter sphagniphilus]MDH6241273.1 malonyl-CoA/methylmalonyl-CoA synthetase [Polynucleobacter sphagniphilus]MDH6301144.1 malonyl-CoA/methylmalonyl-CoA synthetase [Polynucleobacter sphagniphilus]